VKLFGSTCDNYRPSLNSRGRETVDTLTLHAFGLFVRTIGVLRGRFAAFGRWHPRQSNHCCCCCFWASPRRPPGATRTGTTTPQLSVLGSSIQRLVLDGNSNLMLVGQLAGYARAPAAVCCQFRSSEQSTEVSKTAARLGLLRFVLTASIVDMNRLLHLCSLISVPGPSLPELSDVDDATHQLMSDTFQQYSQVRCWGEGHDLVAVGQT
jgi:hypothetical protein